MALSSLQPPVANEYAGDEVSAIVLDSGYSTTRAGFAGEDVPRSVVPSFYGTREDSSDAVFGENAIHNPLLNLNIRNPWTSKGIIEDWERAAKLWEYCIVSRLTCTKQQDPSTNGLNDTTNGNVEARMDALSNTEQPLDGSPLLMSEPGWASVAHREKCLEIAMEDWGAPAFYIQKTGVLAAFASGKPSALVIDVGAATTSVTPVIDGLAIKKGVIRSPLAGNFVSNQIRLMFQQSQPQVSLTPHYMVSSKTPVEAGAAAQATYHKFAREPTVSFRRLQEERVFTEFKESVVQAWINGRLAGNADDMYNNSPGRPFEMPDGWNEVFRAERFKTVEGLFDAKAALTDTNNPMPRPDQTMAPLVSQALAQVDVEMRPAILSNIVVTGGSSLIVGFTERLNQEISQAFPGPRIRLQAPGNTIERKYASWIGGSILGSLGSFHQLWISKREYDEYGPGIVEKRCK